MTAITTTASNVQNGTEILEANFPEKMAKRFRSYARKTSESFLEMARVVEEMKRVTNKHDFDMFCSLIGFESDSPTIRKFNVIGKNYHTLIAYTDKLPANWTTLYEIARIDPDVIEARIEEGVITPITTCAELKKLISDPSKVTQSNKKASVLFGTSAKFEAVIQHKLSANDQKALKKLKEQLEAFGVIVQIEYAVDQTAAPKTNMIKKTKGKQKSTASLVEFLEPTDDKTIIKNSVKVDDYVVNYEQQKYNYKYTKKHGSLVTNTLEVHFA